MSYGSKGYFLAQLHVAYGSVRGSASCLLIRDLVTLMEQPPSWTLPVITTGQSSGWLTVAAKQLNALAQKQHVSALLSINWPGLATWLYPVPRSQEMARLSSPGRRSRCQRAAPTSSTLGISAHETTEKRDERNRNHISGEEKAWLLGFLKIDSEQDTRFFFSLCPLTSEELFINSLCTW